MTALLRHHRHLPPTSADVAPAALVLTRLAVWSASIGFSAFVWSALIRAVV